MKRDAMCLKSEARISRQMTPYFLPMKFEDVMRRHSAALTAYALTLYRFVMFLIMQDYMAENNTYGLG